MLQLGVWASGCTRMHMTWHGCNGHRIAAGARMNCPIQCCVVGVGFVTAQSTRATERCSTVRQGNNLLRMVKRDSLQTCIARWETPVYAVKHEFTARLPYGGEIRG